MSLARRHCHIETAAALVWLGTSLPAAAHSPWRQLGDFYTGVLHPVSTAEHLCTLLMTGLLAGQAGSGRARLHVSGIAAAAMVGWLIPVRADGLAGAINLLLPALLLAGGACLALAWRPSVWLHAGAAILSGTCIALATHIELSAPGGEWVIGAGVMTAVAYASLVAAAVASRFAASGDWKAWSVRVMGSWLGTLGLILLVLRL